MIFLEFYLVLFVSFGLLINFCLIFLNFLFKFSGRFDTSGSMSMIPLSVSEISALDGFCDEDGRAGTTLF